MRLLPLSARSLLRRLMLLLLLLLLIPLLMSASKQALARYARKASPVLARFASGCCSFRLNLLAGNRTPLNLKIVMMMKPGFGLID